jgi:hypothetical protein
LVSTGSSEVSSAAFEPQAAPLSPVEAVFLHWVFMFGRNRNRCALGPTRKRTIERALDLYGVDTLLLAIEGCASSAWHAGDNDRQRTYQDLQLILRDEEHVERFAAMGDALRERVVLEEKRAQAEPVVVEMAPSDPAQVALQRERLAQMAARLRSGRG